jgi:threonine dehydrogenase-like Zn-dependent dehydrogenase
MRANVWKESGRVELQEWPDPDYSTDGLIIEVKAAGICSTDIHMIKGELDFAKPPWVLGHEIAGVIRKVGSQVRGWSVGERVIVDPVMTCGVCRYCLSGKKYLCRRGGELGTTYGAGGYGEYIVVKPQNLYRLPDELSFAEGALMEPLNCTLGAMDRVPDIAGGHAIVFGSGPAGLLFTQLAKVYGALSVTLVGLDDESLRLGKELGADEIINLRGTVLEDAVKGKTYQVAIEASGSVQAVADCFEHVESGGTVVLYGLHGTGTATVDTDKIVRKDLTVVTCISAPLLWEKCIRFVQAGKIDLSRMITNLIPFEEAGSFVNAMADGSVRPIKAVIVHP